MTLFDIKESLRGEIKAKLPSHKIYAVEVKEGFKRPAFFVEVIPVNIQNRLYYKDVSVTVNIRYYPEGETYEEIMDISDKLTEIFGATLKVGDRVLTINNQESETTDEDGNKYLQFSFDLNYQDGNNVLQVIGLNGEPLVMLLDETLGYTEGNIHLMSELELTEE